MCIVLLEANTQEWAIADGSDLPKSDKNYKIEKQTS